MTVYILIDQFQIMHPSCKTLHQSLHLKNGAIFLQEFLNIFHSQMVVPLKLCNQLCRKLTFTNWTTYECSLQKIGTFMNLRTSPHLRNSSDCCLYKFYCSEFFFREFLTLEDFSNNSRLSKFFLRLLGFELNTSSDCIF